MLTTAGLMRSATSAKLGKAALTSGAPAADLPSRSCVDAVEIDAVGENDPARTRPTRKATAIARPNVRTENRRVTTSL
jgi:hypothetical protein